MSRRRKLFIGGAILAVVAGAVAWFKKLGNMDERDYATYNEEEAV